MNIIEAIKSGKPFKRKSWTHWHSEDETSRYEKDEILADDWEIQEKTITITESQFNKVWEQLLNAHESYCLIKNFKKRLGF